MGLWNHFIPQIIRKSLCVPNSNQKSSFSDIYDMYVWHFILTFILLSEEDL